MPLFPKPGLPENAPPPNRVHRSAYTLLELLAASAILGSVLVATLTMLRDSITMGEHIEHAQAMTSLATSKMEEHLALTAADFSTASESGNFSTEGYATLRYSAVRTDSVLSGGVSGTLMAVIVTVWRDDNGDTLLTSGEPAVTMASKMAKLASYVSLAEGS